MRSHEIPEKVSQLIERASVDVHRDESEHGWNPSDLPEPIATTWAVLAAQGIIDNGGLQYFFENNWPESVSYAFFSNAYRTIGASEAADCIDKAASLFPSSHPESDLEMRRNFMEKMEEKGRQNSPFYPLSIRLLDLGGGTMIALSDFIRAHENRFPSLKRSWWKFW